ncbi:MAG TPA: hypothetical protein VG817_11635 [Gemmatimonadales bacterium]|nr:hypothetical protein [Gemmatimonadales bacterium]
MLIALLSLMLSQDTKSVTSVEPAVWSAALPLKASLRLGTLDGAPEYSFGSIQQLAATSTGGFVIFDRADTQLRRYDPSGTFAGLIGRAGAGPGEYRSVEGLLFIGDSLLLAWDPPNGRVTIFAATGEYRRSIPVTGGIFGGNRPILPAPGGFLLRVAEAVRTPTDPFATHYLLFDTNGRILDTVPEPATGRAPGHFVLMTTDGPRWNFPQESLFAFTPTGDLVRGHSSELGFTVIPHRGTRRHVTRPTRPLRLEGAERQQWEAWLAFFQEQQPMPSRHSLPSHKPLARSFQVDAGNRLWIEVYAEATSRPPKPRPAGDKRPQFTLRDASTYEVFTISGRYLGRVSLEPESTILDISASHLYVLTHGPDGEEQIAVYHLPSTPN